MVKQQSEPGSKGENYTKKWFSCRDRESFCEGHVWHPTKPKIQEWVDFKSLEFTWEENEGSWLNITNWLERYLYTNIHEIFFCEFPILFYEWLLKLETQWKKFQGGEPIEWNPQLIQGLKSISNPMSRVVDFWVDNILEGHSIEFVVET